MCVCLRACQPTGSDERVTGRHGKIAGTSSEKTKTQLPVSGDGIKNDAAHGQGGEPCEAGTRGKQRTHHVLAPAGRLRRSVFSASRQLAAAAPCTRRPKAGHSTPSRHDAEEEGPRGRNPQRLHLERVWRLFKLGLRCRRSVWTCRLACARTRARSRVLCKRVMATGGVSSSQRS